MAHRTSTRAAKIAKPAKKTVAKRVAAKPTLLAGGNPRIAKADGDAPEDDLDEAQIARWIRQAAALPGWGKA